MEAKIVEVCRNFSTQAVGSQAGFVVLDKDQQLFVEHGVLFLQPNSPEVYHVFKSYSMYSEDIIKISCYDLRDESQCCIHYLVCSRFFSVSGVWQEQIKLKRPSFLMLWLFLPKVMVSYFDSKNLLIQHIGSLYFV